MKVRYIYSACTVTETPSCKILSDPWFTQGAYEGSWWQYPAVENPVETIGAVDLIYISHSHPDHYDPLFLQKYLKVYPKTPIVIPSLKNNALHRRMVFDGFNPEIVTDLTIGTTRMRLWPNRNPTMPVDSAMIIVDGDEVVANVNDNPLDEEQIAALLEVSGDKRINLLMAPYTGAGPYPQTYYFSTEEARAAAAEKKKQQFITVFRTYMDRFNPIRALPFAGKYYLSGRLAHLNDKRGVIDPVDLLHYLPKEYAGRVLILADGGHAAYDLSTDTASAVRTERYSPEKLQAFLKSIEGVVFDYAKEIVPVPPRHALPIPPLLKTAVHLAKKRFQPPAVPLIAFRIFNKETVYLLFIKTEEVKKITRAEWQEQEKDHPFFVEIDLDERLLFGLLTRLYQWNNAEIGSLYFCRRVPEAYDEAFYSFLVVLHV